MLEIREGDFQAFFRAPFECYSAEMHWSSPMKGDLQRALDATRNPLFRDHGRCSLFTAHRGEKVVGRILAHVHDAYNRQYGQSRGCFGLLDVIDDQAVTNALVARAGDWLRARDCTEIAGSFNLSITQMVGVMTSGFEHRPYTYQEWSPPYLARHLEQAGFEAFFPMQTYESDLAKVDPDSVLGPKSRALLADPAWTFLPIRRRGFEGRLVEACSVLNDGFASNPMFVPLSEEEFLFPCDGMMWVIDETISWTAYHAGRPMGVLLAIPDLNPFLRANGFKMGWKTPWHLIRFKFQRDRAAIIFFSVRQEVQGLGINAILLHKMLLALKRAGYQQLGISWVSESNKASQRQMEKLHARPLHRLHLFRKPL